MILRGRAPAQAGGLAGSRRRRGEHRFKFFLCDKKPAFPGSGVHHPKLRLRFFSRALGFEIADLFAVGRPVRARLAVAVVAGDASFLAARGGDNVDMGKKRGIRLGKGNPLAVGRPLRIGDGSLAEADHLAGGNDLILAVGDIVLVELLVGAGIQQRLGVGGPGFDGPQGRLS